MGNGARSRRAILVQKELQRQQEKLRDSNLLCNGMQMHGFTASVLLLNRSEQPRSKHERGGGLPKPLSPYLVKSGMEAISK